MIPVVCIVGKPNAGKTTLLEKLIPEILNRGYRIAAVKHNAHGFEVDHPGKDSWRLKQAGSRAVVISSPTKLALIQDRREEASLEEISHMLAPSADIILAEGYKRSRFPKIEVRRKVLGEDLICTVEELIAVATDEPLDLPVLQVGLDDAAALANAIEEKMGLRSGRGQG